MFSSLDRSREGLTLVEVMVAMVIVVIIATGAMSYQFHAVKQTRYALAQITATQIAQTILEDWKANGGFLEYNPENLDMDMERIGTSYGMGGYANTEYRMASVINNLPLRLELSRPIVTTAVIPITVIVRWRIDYTDNPIRSTDPRQEFTTYARMDQAGG